MAAFAIAFLGTQSADGLTLTFTDTSNWSGNTEGYARSGFVRTFTIVNAYGTTLKTAILGNSTDVTTLAITADTYVTVTLTIVGVVSFSKVYSFPTFYRIAKNLYRALLSSVGCNCGNPIYENALNTADRLFRGVDIAGISGDGPGWQEYSGDAYTILSQYPS